MNAFLDEPLWRIPVRSDLRWKALLNAAEYGTVVLFTWTMLPRTGLTGWPLHALEAATWVLVFFFVRSLVLFENSAIWVQQRDAQRRHQARLHVLLEEHRGGQRHG